MIGSDRQSFGGKAMNTRLLMMMHVNVATPQNIGAVPHGTRRTAPLSGGDFEGPRLRGTLLPGGSADWLLLRADDVLEMELRVTLRPAAGAPSSWEPIRFASPAAA